MSIPKLDTRKMSDTEYQIYLLEHLKPEGTLVFSWEHMEECYAIIDGRSSYLLCFKQESRSGMTWNLSGTSNERLSELQRLGYRYGWNIAPQETRITILNVTNKLLLLK